MALLKNTITILMISTSLLIYTQNADATVKRFREFAPQAYETLYDELCLGIQQSITAYIIHYFSQNITNALYTTTPEIEDSIASPFISLAQTISAYSLTKKICLKTTGNHNIFAHILGWVYATYTPKLAKTIKNYWEKDHCKKESTSTTEVLDQDHDEYYVPRTFAQHT